MKHEAFLHLQEELKEVPFESWLRNSRYYTLSTFSAQKPCTSVARIIINGEEVSYTLSVNLILKDQFFLFLEIKSLFFLVCSLERFMMIWIKNILPIKL